MFDSTFEKIIGIFLLISLIIFTIMISCVTYSMVYTLITKGTLT
jgi:hypothetical protein